MTLNITADASLTDALKEINVNYTKANPNVTIVPNFAASGALQTQIQSGAPVDVFISASAMQMDNVQKDQLILMDTRRNLLSNNLVLITPKDRAFGLTDFKGLTGDKVQKIAIGDPKSVPAGTYAMMAFDELGITSQLQPKLIFSADVRIVLACVETGNVDAGIVYGTDAISSSKVDVMGVAPADINAKIIYPVAVVKASKNADAARAYENYLFGPQARVVFQKYGFAMAANN